MSNLNELLNLILEEPSIVICDNDTKMKILSEIDFIADIKFKSVIEAENDLLGYYDDISIYLIKKRLNVKYDRAKKIYDSLIIGKITNDNEMEELRLYLKDYYHEKKNYDKRIILLTKPSMKLEYALKNINNVIKYKFKYNDHIKAYKYKNIINEVEATANRIAKIYKENNYVNFDDFTIYIANSEYFNVIKNVFSFYNIPISYNIKESLYNIPKVKILVDNMDINNPNLDLIKNDNIKDVFIRCYNKLAIIDFDKSDLIDELNNTSLNTLNKGIKIRDVSSFNPLSKFTFILGFTFKNMPKIHKDDEYYNDDYLIKYGFNSSMIENKKEKNYVIDSIRSMDLVYVSYSLAGISEKYVETDILDNYVKFVFDDEFKFKFSKERAKLDYKKSIEQKLLTGFESEYLDSYKNEFGFIHSFDSSFKGINPEIIKNRIIKDNNINASYSKIEKYMECPFEYYCNYILNLNVYNGNTDIGSVLHKYLEEKLKNDNYTLDLAIEEFNNTTRGEKFHLREPYITKYNNIIDKLVLSIKNFDIDNDLELVETEAKRTIFISENPTITLTGSIDKLMNKNGKCLIIDYKSGKKISLPKDPSEKDLNKNADYYKKYQLFIYLLFEDTKYENFAGVLYQRIMPKNELDMLNVDNGKLFNPYGYVSNNMPLSIKCQEITNDQYDKVMDDTKNLILAYKDGLLNSRFDIKPISGVCKFCNYKNICYYSYKEDGDEDE